MFTKTRKALALNTAIALLTASMGCADIPEFYGPLCEDAVTESWSRALDRPKLDHSDYYTWDEDPELEARLRSYGMDGSWEFLAGNDIDEEGIVVSPYGKTLNAYELIVTTPGLEEWAKTLAQSYPVHGSCGSKAPNQVAMTWHRGKSKRIDVYEHFYELNVVARAGFLIHEAAHAAGVSGHVDNRDQCWEDHGAYRVQVEFLAALYHSPDVPEEFREAALGEFEWMIDDKFVEPIAVTIADLRPQG